MSQKLSLSIVIPVMNERDNIRPLVEEIHSVLDSTHQFSQWELIIVDDGSTDGTIEIVNELALTDPLIKAIIFRKNFGKSAALMAAFHQVQGEVIITMDGDLQDNPKEIPRLVEKLQEGYDLVSGWKSERKDPIEKRFASKIFNGVISRASGVYIHDFNCGLKAYRRWCTQILQLRGNHYRYIPAILSWYGAKITELSVEHRKRVHGKSKYGLSRYFHGAFDFLTLILLTKFSQNPSYLFALVSLPFLIIGAVTGVYLFGSHILFHIFGDIGENLNSRPLLIISLSLFGMGIQILLIGLVSELVLRSSNNTRAYSIKQVVQKESADKKHL